MLFGRRGDSTKAAIRRPWRLSAKLLIASSVATVIGFSAICANVMLDMRRGEEELARQMLENLAAGIDADIGRNIEFYDLSLRAVASNLVMPEIKDVSKPILHLILFDHAATAKHFGAIQVFDASGQLTIDASSLDPRPENRSDEEYFQVHRDNPDAGPVHQPPDAASRRLFDRAEPAHHRRGRPLSRRGRGLDPLQLFPRTVRPAEPRCRRYDHRAAPRPHHHHAQAVRPRRHRQEPCDRANLEPEQSEGQRIICRTRPGRRDTPAVRPARQHRSVLCRGRKAARRDLSPLAAGR